MARRSRLLARQERQFYDLFEAAGANLVHAAELLERMLDSWPDHAELAREIVECERRGDRITHDIIERLNRRSVPAAARENIRALASALDDVVDFTEEVAALFGLYRIEAPIVQAQVQSRLLLEACHQIEQAIASLRDHDALVAHLEEIGRIESQADRVVREALGSLFEVDGIDPMLVIRWKDIFERLEEAVDATERTAAQLSNLAIR